MGGTTPVPWSIPYPTGTDRVADGDNAMQALAERVAVISNALPRGLIGTGVQAGSAAVIGGDTTLVTLPSVTFSETRDVSFAITGLSRAGTQGCGIDFSVWADGVKVSNLPIVMEVSAFEAGFSINLSGLAMAAGPHVFTLHAAGYGAVTSTCNQVRLSVYDNGASGPI